MNFENLNNKDRDRGQDENFDPRDSFEPEDLLDLSSEEITENSSQSQEEKIWETWREIDKQIESNFKLKDQIDASGFLENYNINKLFDLIIKESGIETIVQASPQCLVLSFDKLIQKLRRNDLQIFIATEPRFEQVIELLNLPEKYQQVVLAKNQSTAGRQESFSCYSWNQIATYLAEIYIPECKNIDQLSALVNASKKFISSKSSLLQYALIKGFEIGEQNLDWMYRFSHFEKTVEICNYESPIGLIKELFLNLEPEAKTDPNLTKRILKILSGNFLQDRLISGTNGGETFLNQLDQHSRQAMHYETPEAAIRNELQGQRNFLFSYLHGRQQAGFQLSCPLAIEEQKNLTKIAELSGFSLEFNADKLVISFNNIENYGGSYFEIAKNLRKELRSQTFGSAADFVSYFDPLRLPRPANVPYLDYAEPSLAVVREQSLNKLVTIVFFEELLRQLPIFIDLNPNAREVRSLLELQNKIGFDIRHSHDASLAHDQMMHQLFEQYLGNAKSISDWNTIVSYRTVPAAEYERQQSSAYNHYAWNAIKIGDQGLQWMNNSVWGDRFKRHGFNETNTLRAAFDHLAESERNDQYMIPRAIALIHGSYLRKRAQDTLANDPTSQLKIALASAITGIPVSEFDPKQIDESQLNKIENFQKQVMIKYLKTRLEAGVEIRIPAQVCESLISQAANRGFRILIQKNQFINETDYKLTQVEQIRSLFEYWSSTVTYITNQLSKPFELISKTKRAWKRGWW